MKLTKDDYKYAYDYIRRAMHRPDSGISKFEGYLDFKASDNAESLKEWCESYLDEKQIKKMKQSVRSSRLRLKNTTKRSPRSSLDISFAAKQSLGDLKASVSPSDKLTISELLIRLGQLNEDWFECGYVIDKHAFYKLLNGHDIDELKEYYRHFKR